MSRFLAVSALLLLSVGCDQATKQIASATLTSSPIHFFDGLLRLQYAENPGAFLSLGGTLPPALRFWLLTVLVGVLLVGLVVYAVASRKLQPLEVTALALIAGGGLSNWIDRVFADGRVVDFLNVGIGSLRTGIFNVADVGIMLGGALLFFSSMRHRRKQPPVAEV